VEGSFSATDLFTEDEEVEGFDQNLDIIEVAV